jgi:hypothetical protein
MRQPQFFIYRLFFQCYLDGLLLAKALSSQNLFLPHRRDLFGIGGNVRRPVGMIYNKSRL